ncbi:Hypothetical protein D9617_1g079600 [Elsinoe fawcettii]|nr:Hypothetical protein D9617_1g079600 [Elsinoe fawcettii]
MPPLDTNLDLDSDAEDEYLISAAAGPPTPSSLPAKISPIDSNPPASTEIPTAPLTGPSAHAAKPPSKFALDVRRAGVDDVSSGRLDGVNGGGQTRRGSGNGLCVSKDSTPAPNGKDAEASVRAINRPVSAFSSGFAVRGAAARPSATAGALTSASSQTTPDNARIGSKVGAQPSGSTKRKAGSASPALDTNGAASPRDEPFRIRKKSRTEATTATEADQRQVDSTRSTGTPVTSGGSTPQPNTFSTAQVRVTIPEWYKKLKKSQSRTKGSSNEDQALARLKGYIDSSKNFKASGRNKILDDLIEAIHNAMFLSVSKQLVRDHRLLNDDGLQAIFTLPPADHDKYPFYTRLDAENLFHKWANGDFGVDLLHGLKYSAKDSISIRPNYPLKRDGAVFGNNELVNGQWWPFQMCLVRDGAHKSAMGGIAGRTGTGAFSLIMAGGLDPSGKPYPDKDEGETVWYCGTDGKEGEISSGTQLLLDNYTQGLALRFMRSAKASHSPYKPAQGIRYDGLYKITDYEILGRAKERHRFKLVREPGQDPIRYQGPGVRPTRQELEAAQRLKEEKQFVVS